MQYVKQPEEKECFLNLVPIRCVPLWSSVISTHQNVVLEIVLVIQDLPLAFCQVGCKKRSKNVSVICKKISLPFTFTHISLKLSSSQITATVLFLWEKEPAPFLPRKKQIHYIWTLHFMWYSFSSALELLHSTLILQHTQKYGALIMRLLFSALFSTSGSKSFHWKPLGDLCNIADRIRCVRLLLL